MLNSTHASQPGLGQMEEGQNMNSSQNSHKMSTSFSILDVIPFMLQLSQLGPLSALLLSPLRSSLPGSFCCCRVLGSKVLAGGFVL